jgi:lysine-specific demethylase/histidyl-hydroxylase NO66
VAPPDGLPPEEGLARLVGHDVDAFLHDDLGRRPRLHRAGADLAGLLTVDDVDELLTGRALRAPGFRLVRDGSPLPRSTYTRSGRIGGVAVDDLPDAGRVLAHVDAGATLVLQALHRYWPPVAGLCRELEDALTHPVQANAYLTPPDSRGLDVHHDTHDVLAVQLAGRKHWVVHRPAVESPLASQPWSRDRHEPGPVVLDTTLAPGDCLYLPRGTPHAAETAAGVSLHLTIGIRAVTWVDVLGQAMEQLADEPDFRRSLPAGFGRDPEGLATEVAAQLEEAAAWLRKQDPAGVAAAVVARRDAGRLPRLEGQLRRQLAADAVDDASRVRLRAGGLTGTREAADGRLELVTPDRVVALPAALADVLAPLLAGATVPVADLAPLDGDGRRVLARRLVREGVVEVVEGPGAGGSGDAPGA